MTDVVEEDGICSGIVATAQDGTEMKILRRIRFLQAGESEEGINIPRISRI